NSAPPMLKYTCTHPRHTRPRMHSAPITAPQSNDSSNPLPVPDIACLTTKETRRHVLSFLQTRSEASGDRHSPHALWLAHLVYTLEGRHRLALVLVQSGGDDLAVRQVHLLVRLLLEAERVLHPVLVVTVREVLAGVRTTRLLAGGGGSGGLNAEKFHVSVS